MRSVLVPGLSLLVPSVAAFVVQPTTTPPPSIGGEEAVNSLLRTKQAIFAPRIREYLHSTASALHYSSGRQGETTTTTTTRHPDEQQQRQDAPVEEDQEITSDTNDGDDDQYWFNDKIHTLGNRGWGGALHAAYAPLATKMIDVMAYSNVDVRRQVANDLAEVVVAAANDDDEKPANNGGIRILDLCSGVGMSTGALRDAFPRAKSVVGLDTSPEMIGVAKFRARHLTMAKHRRDYNNNNNNNNIVLSKEQRQELNERTEKELARFVVANAERAPFADESFDLITIMYAFHEIPAAGRNRILREAQRLLAAGGTLAIVDITTDYEPSKSMLDGEPYVLEYQQNIDDQLNRVAQGFSQPTYRTYVPGRVGMWLLQIEEAPQSNNDGQEGGFE